MEELIDIVNQLQCIFTTCEFCCNINLPQVVVIGSQSSGKSSVLESIVARSFLPRGSGVVTRCPLILQMVRTPGNSTKEYVIFEHDQNRQEYTDDSLIRREILKQTELLSGTNKKISNKPIILKLFSPSLVSLTLVDLPGMTKVAVGDQPDDIEEQITSLVKSYIENSQSIIVAVSPANMDIVTSDSLKLAKEVDPDGGRTIAVLTKLDLMDRGTDALEVLSGRTVPVKLGIIGVVNRSQEDIVKNKSLKDSLADEAKFLNSNYKNISSLHGSVYLTKKLQELFIGYIKSGFPELKQKIQEKLSSANEDLEKIKESDLEKSALLLRFVTKFSESYKDAITGNSRNICRNTLFGGAKILQQFEEIFSTCLMNVDAFSNLSERDIKTAIKNASGVESTLFIPENAFNNLVKTQIKNLRKPCLQCVDNVSAELSNVTEACVTDPSLGLSSFQNLQKTIRNIVETLIKAQTSTAKQMVEHFINVQTSYINKSHYNLFTEEWKNPLNKGDKGQKSLGAQSSFREKDERDYNLMRLCIETHFNTVRQSVLDTIPKIIMHFLVYFLVDEMQKNLIEKTYKCDEAEDLLEESQVIVDKREKLKENIEALQDAIAIYNKISDQSGLHLHE